MRHQGRVFMTSPARHQDIIKEGVLELGEVNRVAYHSPIWRIQNV
jgi:hypothetical protein